MHARARYLQGDQGEKGERGLTTTFKGDQFPTGIIEGPPGPPGPAGECVSLHHESQWDLINSVF